MSFVFRSEEFTARYHVPSYAALARRVRHDAGVRLAPAGAADPAAPLHERALGAEVAGAPALAAHPARRVSRRAPRRHPPRSAHRARVAHQPGRDLAVGAQRPTSTSPTSVATTSTCTTARSTVSSISPTNGTLDGAHGPSHALRRVHGRPDRHRSRAVADALGDPLDDATAAAMRAYLDDASAGSTRCAPVLVRRPRSRRRRGTRALRALPVVLRRPRRESDAMTDRPRAPSGTQLPRRPRRARRARITSDAFPARRSIPTRAFRHVAQQTLCWLSWAIGHDDPTAPRSSARTTSSRSGAAPTPTTCTGTRGSTPAARTGSAGGCTRARTSCWPSGAGLPAHRARRARSPSSPRQTRHRRGHDFEILLGGEGDEPNRVPLPEGAIMCSIREYYFDWQPREPATFTIEYLGGRTGDDRRRRSPTRSTKHSTSPNGRSCTGTST